MLARDSILHSPSYINDSYSKSEKTFWGNGYILNPWTYWASYKRNLDQHFIYSSFHKLQSYWGPSDLSGLDIFLILVYTYSGKWLQISLGEVLGECSSYKVVMALQGPTSRRSGLPLTDEFCVWQPTQIRKQGEGSNFSIVVCERKSLPQPPSNNLKQINIKAEFIAY